MDESNTANGSHSSTEVTLTQEERSRLLDLVTICFRSAPEERSDMAQKDMESAREADRKTTRAALQSQLACDFEWLNDDAEARHRNLLQLDKTIEINGVSAYICGGEDAHGDKHTRVVIPHKEGILLNDTISIAYRYHDVSHKGSCASDPERYHAEEDDAKSKIRSITWDEIEKLARHLIMLYT